MNGINYAVGLQRIAQDGAGVPVGPGSKNAATATLAPATRQIRAGGPGSGRKPGYGRQKGSDVPMGMNRSVHNTLTQSGFQHKDAWGLRKGDYNMYQHPQSGQKVVVRNGSNWSTHGPGFEHRTGVGRTASDRTGQGPQLLKDHLGKNT